MEATTRQMLERLADRIEATLAEHKISVRITGGQLSPRWIQFQALPALGTEITGIEAMVDVLAAAVDESRPFAARQAHGPAFLTHWQRSVWRTWDGERFWLCKC